MADNPIKHSDIIQPGNAFKDTLDGVDKLIKVLKKAAKEYKKFATIQNISTKEGKKNIQATANATQGLTTRQKELLKTKQQLERADAKLRQMGSAEYKQLIRTKEAIKAKDAAMRKSIKTQDKGAKSTNRWGKALGSFAFKFNALGNIASNVASRITRTISRALRGAIDIVVEFDLAMADVKAITGATGDELDKLSKSARKLGGITKFTASQVAQLQKEYAKLGFTTKEILAAQGATLDLSLIHI